MPSSHSGSSHSSGGFSSHSSGPSSHSSSSHSSSWSSSGSSSGSDWGSSGSDWGSRHGPARHSAGSRSSGTVIRSHYVRSGSMRGEVIQRSRVNQPGGFRSGGHSGFSPTRHYCVNHNYDYFPFAWTDFETGKQYEKGYYDENGEYYEDVAFLEDGTYKNVLCQCEYCDTVTKLDWSEGGPLICPQCGGSMKLLSKLDEYTRDPGYAEALLRPDYVDYADRDMPEPDDSDAGKSPLAFFAFLSVFFFLFIAFIAIAQEIDSNNRNGGNNWAYYGEGAVVHYGENGVVYYNSPDEQNWDEGGGNLERFGSVIWLKESGPDAYARTEDPQHDKELVWDEAEESYYDEDSGLWLWYNTDVWPNLWQYWYEPISGDYGDYGWMEYESGVWYIEVDAAVWEPVSTDDYDVSPLWHIAEDEAQAPEAPADAEPSVRDGDDTDEDLLSP